MKKQPMNWWKICISFIFDVINVQIYKEFIELIIKKKKND